MDLDMDGPNILFQVESGEDDLTNDRSKRVWQDVLLFLVRCLRCRRHNQPEDIQVREEELIQDVDQHLL